MRIKILAFLASLLFVFACAPKALYRAGWQKTPVTADGNASEWAVPLRFYDSDTKLNYTLSNDNKNIYLCVRVVDELSQEKIMHSGLNIWIDTLAKKTRRSGILFPVPDKANEEATQNTVHPNKKNSSYNDEVKEKFLNQVNQMQLIGFKKNIPDYLAADNEYGLRVSINWDKNNIMIYEAVIPFNTFYKPALEPKDSIKNFDFAITIHGFTAPKKEDDNSSNANNSMGSGGMGGGMGGNGMGMGSMGGGNGRMNTMRGPASESNPRYETNSFWARIHFSAR
ncbi:MAG: hypothetical protein JST67_05405 [Bacteroidetes bacterium]|nr:hypothetical protein [Bacteroidota bacterium]